MIQDCKLGKIDMLITKSISRFARNTLDCLNFVRLLKDLGIGVIFEKENINTLDSKVGGAPFYFKLSCTRRDMQPLSEERT